MLDRVTEWLASERAVAFLGYVIGAVVGVRAAEGMGFSEWIWAGIAILGVIQLRLFALEGAPVSESTEEA